MDFYFYLDLGSGDQLISPGNVKVKLSWRRGELNDFIIRKELEGSFTVHDDYADAKTHFITNGFEEAVIKIYQNDIKGVGVLKYEGWTKVKGLWDDRRSLVVFDSFRTNDQYTDFISIINNNHYGNSFGAFDTFFNLGAQGQATNANKLYNITFSTPTFTVLDSSATVPNLGRCSATYESNEIIVYDNYNTTLKGYEVPLSGDDWTETRSRNLGNFARAASVTGLGSGRVGLYYENGFYIEYDLDGGTSFTSVPLSDDFITSSVKFPSTAATNGVPNRIAVVSEDSSSISILINGDSISVGNVLKPNICELNTNTIAFIDAKQKKLTTYQYIVGTRTWSKLGDGLLITGLTKPIISKYTNDQIILHDANAGILRKYDFNSGAGTWSQDGNTLGLGNGGYSSALAVDTGNIFVAMTDTFIFKGSPMYDLWTVVNNVLSRENKWGVSAPLYQIENTSYGATIDLRKAIVGDMSNVADNELDAGDNDLYEYNLVDTLKSIELWQNYWYIDSSNKIKFTQPNLFSSIGSKFDITSLNLVDELDQRLYNSKFDIDKEETLFINAFNPDFAINRIDYSRNTSVLETTNYNFTTDFDFLISVYTNQQNRKIENTGLLLYYNDDTGSKPLASSGTGIISAFDIKNYKVSQSQIYNDFQKDYRYKAQGNITINGASSAVQDTCRSIIEFPDVHITQFDVGITEFPDSVSNLIWDTGIESLIMLYEHDLDTNIITIKSRLHDL